MAWGESDVMLRTSKNIVENIIGFFKQMLCSCVAKRHSKVRYMHHKVC
jgi:hypothetical protein